MAEITSNVGLVNLALQGGSFAVLVMGLGWAAYWLPRWMADAEKTRQAEASSREKVAGEYREAVKVILDGNRLAVGDILKEFALQQRYEREQCAQQFSSLMSESKSHREIQLQSLQLLQAHHAASMSYIERTSKG